MVTYLRKSINNVIHRNKKFSLTYLNEKGDTRTLKSQKDLFSLCMAVMNESELIENGIIEQYSFDIDNACRYAWGFDTKKALFTIINNLEHLDITVIQATYNKNQIYSFKNENLKLEELENVKQQRDVYKKQVDVQKKIIEIYQDSEDDEELEI